MSVAHSAPSSRAMIGFAVLRANFNQNAPSYVDNFAMFVLDSIARENPRPVTSAEIGADLRVRFGLTIPDRVVDRILKRMKKGEITGSSRHGYTIPANRLSAVPDLNASVTDFGRKQAQLAAELTEFAGQMGEEAQALIGSDAEKALADYIETNSVPLLSQAIRGGSTKALDERQSSATEYVVASFINNLAERNNASFEYVVDAVKGAILASVVQTDTSALKQRLNGLTFVLDSPVAIQALGYQGTTAQLAVQQTLDLAHELGARVMCFSHSFDEIDGVLQSVVKVVQSRGRRTGPLRDVDHFFLNEGYTAADVELEREHFRERLAKLHVHEQHRPDDYYQHGLDENGLAEMMKETQADQPAMSRDFDVKSLSAIHRLRHGSSPKDFTRCKYVLITDHGAVIKVARQVNKVLGERHGWPLAMPTSDLAALLWVRQSGVHDDLPRQQLLATVHAGMQPGKRLWTKYLDELETLRSRGEVTEDEALILRVRPEAQNALMELEVKAKPIDGPAVTEVLRRIQSAAREPVEAELQAVRDDKAAIEAKAAALAAQEAVTSQQKSEVEQRLEAAEALIEQQRLDVDTAHRERGERNASRWLTFVTALVALPTIAMLVIDRAYPQWTDRVPHWAAVVGWCFFGLGAIFTGVKIFAKGSVREWLLAPEVWLARRLERKYRYRAGLPAQPPEVSSAD